MIYSVFVLPGLENIARQELIGRFGNTKRFRILERKPQRILFEFSGNPKDLLSLRTAEQLFLVIKHLPNMTRSRSSLSGIKKSLTHYNFDKALTCCRQIGISVRKRTTFRVVCRMSGFRNFQKRELQQVIERSLIDRGWNLSGSNTALNVWIEMHGSDAYVSIRLSKSVLAQRSYKNEHVPNTLKPTIAYSMIHLSQPQPNDVFLDPMCGAGTILLERAFAGRYRYLIGGDISTKAINATKKNFGKQHQPRHFFHWDAQTLPIQPSSIDKIVCNLPISYDTDNQPYITNLYKQVLSQCENVVKADGRMVFFSMQANVLNNILNRKDSLKSYQQVGINVNGKKGRIFVVQKQKRAGNYIPA